jgi:hypothetical protein
MTMLDVAITPRTIGRPHFGKDTNCLAVRSSVKPQNKIAAVAGPEPEKQVVPTGVFKENGLTFTTALRAGDTFKVADGTTGIIMTVKAVAPDKRGGAWIITNAPDFRSFHTFNVETVMLYRREYQAVELKDDRPQLIDYTHEPEMIPGMIAATELRRHDKVFVSGVGIRAVGAVTAKSAFCEKGYTLRFEEMPQVIVVHRGDPNEVLRPPTIRSAVGSWPTGDVFQRTGSEPKCPAGQSPAGDGVPADNTPRPKLVQPVPGTQVIIFPGSRDTFEAVQQSRVSAAVAEKSASLTDELNRDLYERVQAKRAARQAAQ